MARTIRPLIFVVVVAMAAFADAVRAAELLMYEEAGCPWCRRWHAEVGAGYPKSPEGLRAPLRRLNISDAKRSDVKLASPITASPTFVLVDNGMEVGRITGYPGADFFWGLLGELLKKLPQEKSDARQIQHALAAGFTSARLPPIAIVV